MIDTGYDFPARASIFWRLPIIRHLRWFYWARRVDEWYALWASIGMLPFYRDRDEAVLDQIWRGER
jgi:hypothetical protein